MPNAGDLHIEEYFTKAPIRSSPSQAARLELRPSTARGLRSQTRAEMIGNRLKTTVRYIFSIPAILLCNAREANALHIYCVAAFLLIKRFIAFLGERLARLFYFSYKGNFSSNRVYRNKSILAT
jgi:hypothetical protein